MYVRCYPLPFILAICVITSLTFSHPAEADEVSSITYTDRSNTSVPVRQHIRTENETLHIHISPLALLDMSQAKMISDPITSRTTIIIPIILYTDEQIKFVLENNENKCRQGTTKCLFYEVSIETMQIIYKDTWDQTNVLHSYRPYIRSIELSFVPLLQKRLLYVNIGCTSKEIRSKFKQTLHRPRKPIGLYLEYSVDRAAKQQVIINNRHLSANHVHASQLVLEYDTEQLLQRLLQVADAHSNDTHIFSQADLFSLKEALRKELFGKTLILTDNNEKQWSTIYWRNGSIARPDRILKLLKKKPDAHYLSNTTLKNNTNPAAHMDDYVQQMYDEKSVSLYRKYRHLFELRYVRGSLKQLTSSVSLKLKPVVAYEINQFNQSRFLVRQTVHITKRGNVYSIPIRTVVLLEETLPTNHINQISNMLQRFRGAPDKLAQALSDWVENKHQPSTTTVRSTSTTTETTKRIESATHSLMYDSTTEAEKQMASAETILITSDTETPSANTDDGEMLEFLRHTMINQGT